MGNSRNSCSLQLGINLNSGATTKEATGTRCAVKVGFGKRVHELHETRKKFGGDPPHKKVMDGVEKDFFYCTKFVGRSKWGHRKSRSLTPKFSQNLDCRKLWNWQPNNSPELSDAARQSRAPHVYAWIIGVGDGGQGGQLPPNLEEKNIFKANIM